MLDLDWSLLVSLISVGVFIVLLQTIFFKPLGQFMEAREHTIEHDLAEAARLRRQAEGALDTYQAALMAARREAAEQMSGVQRSVEARQRELIDRARVEGAAIVTEAQATIARDAAEARAQLSTEAQQLAQQVVAKLVGR